MGVYKVNGAIYLAEWDRGAWIRYNDYTRSIAPSDLWFPAPTTSTVVQFSDYFQSYDFTTQDGRNRIGSWIETAAKKAGR